MLRQTSLAAEPSASALKVRPSVSGYREFQDGELIAGTRYRVVRLIGVGGMGTVYEVEHTELGKRFVLKALLRELSRRQDLVIRLRNEWRALGRLEHPNIVNVTDAGTSSTGVPFYVMERLEGDTLAQRMRKLSRFPVAVAVRIAAAVLDGLSAAHEIGVVHRDVKPPNIFLVNGDHPKILDFGVAKIADDPGVITARGVAVGTPRYMSPEQARGEKVDGRADVYSVGLILYEMIAGVSPFHGARDANELILAQLARPAPPLVETVPDVAPELDAVVLQMLEKRADARPATARDAARALGTALLRVNELAAAVPLPEVRLLDLPERKDDTTRPDGVARKERTASSASPVATSASWVEDIVLGSPGPRVSGSDGTLPSLRAVVTSLAAPEPAHEEPTVPGVGSQRWRAAAPIKATLPTELLSRAEALPARTRTRIPNPPVRPSETPPPVSPPPRSSPPERAPGAALVDRGGPIVWGLGALVFTTGLGFAVASGIRLWLPPRLAPAAAREAPPSAPPTLETVERNSAIAVSGGAAPTAPVARPISGAPVLASSPTAARPSEAPSPARGERRAVAPATDRPVRAAPKPSGGLPSSGL